MIQRAMAVMAAVVFPVGLLAAAPAGAATPPDVVSKSAPAVSEPPTQVARGIIVRSTGTVRALRAAVDALPLGIDIASTRPLSSTTDLLLFDSLVPAARAATIASVLELRRDVVWAEADVRVQRMVTPVIPNDTYFSLMVSLWNGGGSRDYSVKAPLIWGQEDGASNVVVAVIDSGIASHPDLNANVVAGFDFVSDIPSANDGDGWDPNPADPGDWITEAENASGYFEGCGVSDSSWHGTHVAGTVAAIQGNAYGITGVAPGVRVQSVRALGKCGGFTSDIAAAITWASGGNVTGVPTNRTPAKVLNMSLGGNGSCEPDSAYGEAIAAAIARGSTVVVAAGNENEPMTQKRPANCAGVIAVTSVDVNGQRAGYSNYGVAAGQATLAAPGGDFEVRGDPGILSTYNSGLTIPVEPDFAYLQGTSMATPHVAGAAALLYSAGLRTPAQVREALVSAVQPFPTYGNATWDCTTVRCGAGILDLGRLNLTPGATTPGAPTGVSAVAESRTRALVTWDAPANDGGSPITDYFLLISEDGGPFEEVGPSGNTQTGIYVSALEPGTSYRFRVAAINDQGRGDYSEPSSPLRMPQVVVPGQVTGVKAVVTMPTRARLTWNVPDDGGADIAFYRMEFSRDGAPYASLGESGQDPESDIINLRPGSTYTFRVAAVNSAGQGAFSEPSSPVTMPAEVITLPGKVSGFSKSAFTKTGKTVKVTVQWKPPTMTGGTEVTGYAVRLTYGRTSTPWKDFDAPVTVLTALRPGTTYTLEVRAVNAKGPGPVAKYPIRVPRR